MYETPSFLIGPDEQSPESLKRRRDIADLSWRGSLSTMRRKI